MPRKRASPKSSSPGLGPPCGVTFWLLWSSERGSPSNGGEGQGRAVPLSSIRACHRNSGGWSPGGLRPTERLHLTTGSQPAVTADPTTALQRQMLGAQEHQAEPSRSVLEAFLFTLLLRSFRSCQVLSCLSSSFPKSPEGHALPSQQTSAWKHSSLGSCCLHTRLCWLFCLKLATSGLISAQTHH